MYWLPSLKTVMLENSIGLLVGSVLGDFVRCSMGMSVFVSMLVVLDCTDEMGFPVGDLVGYLPFGTYGHGQP